MKQKILRKIECQNQILAYQDDQADLIFIDINPEK